MKTAHTYRNLPYLFFLSAVLCLFGMLFSSQAYAQQEDLLDRVWYLDKLVMDGDTIYSPTREDNELDLASTIFFNSENNGAIDFGGCPGEYHFIGMEFDETGNFFIASGIGGFPFQFCSDFYDYFEGLEEFTDLYFYDFFYGYGMDGDVSIYYAVYNDGTSAQTLILTNPDDYEAHYSSAHLSIPDFEALSISISPNPVSDQLLIRLEDVPTSVKLEVHDMHGRVIHSFDVYEAETQLNVAEYAPGLYFIKLTGDSGSTQTMRFIKQ